MPHQVYLKKNPLNCRPPDCISAILYLAGKDIASVSKSVVKGRRKGD